MARVKYGPLILDISGSIGSATFQKSLYGNTLRNRPRNTRAGTADQFKARNYMMQCQYAWRSMSAALRRQWNQFVAFSGQSINRDRGILTTGHALFLKWNYARLQAGFEIVTELIYKSAPAWPGIQYVFSIYPSCEVQFTTDLVTPNIYPTIFLSPPRPESRSFTSTGLRFMFIDEIFENYAIINNSYQSKFGQSIIPDSFVSCKYQLFHLASPILSAVITGVFKVLVD
jgi:hypothetical protein